MISKRFLTIILSMVVLSVALVPMLSADGYAENYSWQMSNSDARHTSYTSYGIYYTPNEVVWEVTGLSYYQMVSDANGNIYASLSNDSLVSISPQGAINWYLHFEGGLGGSPAIADDGTIYIVVHSLNSTANGIQLYDGLVYAIGADGAILHQTSIADMRDVSDPVIADSGNVLLHVESMVIADNDLLVKDEVLCLSKDLVSLWSYSELRPGEWDKGRYEVPSVAADGSVSLWYNATILHLSKDGELLWRYVPGTFTESFYGDLQQRYPVIIGNDGRIYLTFEDYAICLLPNGTMSWKYHFMSGLVYPLAFFDGYGSYVVFTDDNNVMAISTNGYSMYRTSLGDSYTEHMVMTENGAMVFGSDYRICILNGYSGTDIDNITCVEPDNVVDNVWGVTNCIVSGNNTICYQTAGGDGKIVMVRYDAQHQSVTTTNTMSVQDAVTMMLVVVVLAVLIFAFSYVIPKARKKR